MDRKELEQQLAASIEAALRQHQFASPRTPDTSITDAYADAATEAVMRHLQAEGWLLTNAPGDWSWGRKLGEDELEEALRSSLRFPLLMAPKPALRRDDAEMARYHAAVAKDVVRRLVEGGWSLAPGAGEEAAEQAAFHAAALIAALLANVLSDRPPCLLPKLTIRRQCIRQYAVSSGLSLSSPLN